MKDKEYLVNQGFICNGGYTIYRAGQTLTQVEYNMLDPMYKIHCAEKFTFGFNNDDEPVKLTP